MELHVTHNTLTHLVSPTRTKVHASCMNFYTELIRDQYVSTEQSTLHTKPQVLTYNEYTRFELSLDGHEPLI